jgi:hypothetical protein
VVLEEFSDETNPFASVRLSPSSRSSGGRCIRRSEFIGPEIIAAKQFLSLEIQF